MKATLNRAKRPGGIKENPACLVKPPKINNILGRHLTAEQEEFLLKHLPDKHRPLIVVGLNTGLRQGELLWLTWSDIDWNAGVLMINETKAGGRLRTPMNSTVVGLQSELRSSQESR